MTPDKAKKSDNGEPLPWPRVVAKLNLRGLPAEKIGSMTLYQALMAVDELGEDMKFQARISGCEVPEPDKVATLQDLMGLAL